MHKYYGEQIIGFNEENKKTLKLEADWILSMESDCELGKLVRERMKNKITELDNHTEYIKKQIGL